MSDDNQLSALERLTKLRESGALTEEEFTAQKAAILSGAAAPTTHVPFYRKLWVVVTLTCLILTFWVSLIILATGDVYKRTKDGSRAPIKKTTRYVFAGLLATWMAAVVVKAVVDPESISQRWAESAIADKTGQPTGQTASNGAAAPDTCESSDAADMVKSAIENSPGAQAESLKVLDFGKAQETWFDKAANVRRCAGVAFLNSGQTVVAYQIFFGPSGKEMLQFQTGQQASMQIEVDGAKKEEAQNATKPAPANPQPTPDQSSQQAQPQQPAASQQKIALPNFTDSESYSSVRTKMINAGWEPFHAPDADQCSETDKRCIGRPEMVSCAGTGRANCKFLWKKNDNIAAICTVGEEDATFDVICSYP